MTERIAIDEDCGLPSSVAYSVMLGCQDNISRPSVLEGLGHLVRIPLLRLTVEDGSEVVVTEVAPKCSR